MRPISVAQVLREKRAEILDRWIMAARSHVTAARYQQQPVLLDELPELLELMEKELSMDGRMESVEVVESGTRKTAKSHGEKRAQIPEYDLEQVLWEYHLLRTVVVEVLFESSALASHKEIQSLHATIDSAMTKAGQRFSELRIQEQKRNLIQLKDERELRMRFVRTLAHDLRNPLSVIRAAAQLWVSRGMDSSELKDLATQIVASVDRADKMITDLLDANLIEAGRKIPVQVEKSDLRKVVDTAVGEMTLLNGNRFALVGPPMVTGYWSSSSIRRAVDNLLSNAVKYGDPEKTITVTVGSNGSRAWISVHNFGEPIPKTGLSKLFRQFGRMEPARGGEREGWGIGLTLVRGVVESHGGTVEVDSNRDSGTTFTMWLPLDCRGRRSVAA